MCELKDFDHLKLDDYHRAVLEKELVKWHKTYLPPHRGMKVVLDVGAGNGETAQFFLNHGAELVICIDPEVKLLRENFSNDPRVIIIQAAPDFLKIDGEGCERDMVVETHFVCWMRPIDHTTMLTLWRLEAVPGLGQQQGYWTRDVMLTLYMIRIQFVNVLKGMWKVLRLGPKAQMEPD